MRLTLLTGTALAFENKLKEYRVAQTENNFYSTFVLFCKPSIQLTVEIYRKEEMCTVLKKAQK